MRYFSLYRPIHLGECLGEGNSNALIFEKKITVLLFVLQYFYLFLQKTETCEKLILIHLKHKVSSAAFAFYWISVMLKNSHGQKSK